MEAKGLRGLNADQPLPVDGLVQAIRCTCHRVADRQHGSGRFEELQAGYQAIDDLGRAERPGGIVNEDCIGIDRGEASADRVSPFGTASDEVADVQAIERSRSQVFLSRSNDHPHRLHTWVTNQRFNRPAQDRLARQGSVLLREAAAGTFAFPSCNDECGNGHGARVYGALSCPPRPPSVCACNP